MALDLFKLMDALFDSPKFRNVDESDKKTHFFMVQRFMSITEPTLAQQFNRNGINESNVVNHWNRLMCHKYSKKPNWTFTKKETPKLRFSDDFIKKFDKIDESTIGTYLYKKQLSRKDFNFKLEINPENTLLELQKLQKYLTDDGNRKN